MMLSEELSHMLQRVSCSNYNGKACNSFNIDESKASSFIKRITIKDIDNPMDKDWFSFDPDRGRCGDTITNILSTAVDPNSIVGDKIEHLYHHRACDNIMVINNNGKLHITYFELKCGAESYSYQFKSSKCIMRYLVDVCNIIGGFNFTIDTERFILLHNVAKLADKRVSFQSSINSLKKSDPEKPHKIYISKPTKSIRFEAIFA